MPESQQSKIEELKKICITEFLVPFESYHKRLPNGDCQSYADPASINDPIKKGEPWTIGYGSTFDERGVKVKQGDVWTHEKALRAKESALNIFLSALLKLSPKLILEPSRRIAAVLSWCYNCGMGNYRISTFKKRIDEGDWESAARECLKWNLANKKVMRGLTRRRQAEASAILKP
jgi:lysozyme